jgi:hypothetical protein
VNEFWRKLCDQMQRTDYISAFADPARQIVNIDNYTYTIDGNSGVNITQTVSQAFNVVMDSDSDFVLTYFAGFARSAASTYGATTMIINPAVLLQIKDQASGKNFFNTAAPMAMLCGQGGFPFLLTSPRVIRPRTTLTVTAIAAQNQTFNGFYFCFHGSRIFYAN